MYSPSPGGGVKCWEFLYNPGGDAVLDEGECCNESSGPGTNLNETFDS